MELLYVGLFEFAVLLLQHHQVFLFVDIFSQQLVGAFEALHDFVLALLLHVLFVLEARIHLLVPVAFGRFEVAVEGPQLLEFAAQGLLLFCLLCFPFLDGRLVDIFFGLEELLAVNGDGFISFCQA